MSDVSNWKMPIHEKGKLDKNCQHYCINGTPDTRCGKDCDNQVTSTKGEVIDIFDMSIYND